MIRKQGNTARESNTSNSPHSPLTELKFLSRPSSSLDLEVQNPELVTHPTRYDRHTTRPPPSAAAAALVGLTATGERTNCPLPAAVESPKRAASSTISGRGTQQALKSHQLIPISNTPRVAVAAAANGLDSLPVFLEASQRSWRILDLEYHLDPTREGIFGGPAGVEDYLDDIARRVALRELSQGP